MQFVDIIFSAVIKHTEIVNQTISLGGVYPDIDIECIDKDGLHSFKIRKNLANTHPSMLDPVVKEASSEIEGFWTVLEHVLKSPIHPIEEIKIQHENQSVTPYKNNNSICFQTGLLSAFTQINKSWFKTHKQKFFEDYDFDLLKRVNFAKRLDDPTSRFLSLYSIISSLADDKQEKIDKLILDIDSTVQRKISPHKIKGKEIFETTFTRLRNELAHHRVDASIFSTHQEINLQIDRFQHIVDLIIINKLTNKV